MRHLANRFQRTMLRGGLVAVILLLACNIGGAESVSQPILISDTTFNELRDLRETSKFHENSASFYPGAPNETTRSRCEVALNALIERLIAGLQTHPSKQYVLQQFRITLASFQNEDSEEKDRLLLYLEQIMEIAGVLSSDGMLNEWRYGFDPPKSP